MSTTTIAAPAKLFPTALRSLPARLAALPSALLWLFLFGLLALGHLTLLHLPYFWDEGGYYVPAALDFFRRWTLIPQFTNAHPPLPNVVLGLLWHVVGYHILATRLCAAAFAAAGLVAVFRLAERLLSPAAGLALTLLTATYSIWYAQSTLAHADIFAAAFVLWGFVLYFAPSAPGGPELPVRTQAILLALLFSLAALSKETAIVQPVTLAALEAGLLWRANPGHHRREHLTRALGLLFPILPLAGWYAFHHARTGFTFGNPEYLRYNATANFTLPHIFTALRYRFIHLTFQRDLWLPILIAFTCLLLPRREGRRALPERTTHAAAVLIAANWIAFSVLGGALLTRYLLPVYPLILLLCLAAWIAHNRFWPVFALAVAAAFVTSWWLNPPIAFAPEDNLTYRDMVVVHQDALRYLENNFPRATVLTAWPVAADLNRPELGYVSHPFRVTSLDNFSVEQILQAAQDPGRFDTAIVFTTHYMSPALARYLQKHPGSARGEEFFRHRDLAPEEVARLLHGTVVWKEDRHGEMAAIVRFPRTYQAQWQAPPGSLSR